jgi:hypothetical protein
VTPAPPPGPRVHRPFGRVAARAALIGAALGLAAGLIELAVGPRIRDWVGNKQDTTRLGLATIVLASVALAAALTLWRRPEAAAPRRFALAVGLLVPGLICFTTVGRLWYLPGALLLLAGLAVLADLRTERSEVSEALGPHWLAVLTVVLAGFYVFLGATALGLAGALGILGGLVILALVGARARVPRALAAALLVAATLPFAALTWWSVATPLIALLLLSLGLAAILRPAATAGLTRGSLPRPVHRARGGGDGSRHR